MHVTVVVPQIPALFLTCSGSPMPGLPLLPRFPRAVFAEARGTR